MKTLIVFFFFIFSFVLASLMSDNSRVSVCPNDSAAITAK